MSDESEARRIEPPVVVKSFADLDGESRLAIRRAAASGHVEALAGPRGDSSIPTPPDQPAGPDRRRDLAHVRTGSEHRYRNGSPQVDAAIRGRTA